jgi:hypothetical protein
MNEVSLDDEAFNIINEERISDITRDAFRSMNNSPVGQVQDQDQGHGRGDDEGRDENNDHPSSFCNTSHVGQNLLHHKKCISMDNISIATALTFDASSDEEDDALSLASSTVPGQHDNSPKEKQHPRHKYKAIIQRLGDEVVELKGDVAYIKAREDDYRFTIQTLVYERDLLKMEMMERKNEQDIPRCQAKRLSEEVHELKTQMAELQMKNVMMEQQRDEYRQDRQQLQETLSRVFQSGNGNRMPARDSGGAPVGASELIASIQQVGRRSVKGAGQFWRRRK